MGAIRRIKLHLPKRLHFKHGSYWYISQLNGKQVWDNFGADEQTAITRAIEFNAFKKSEREKILGLARSAERAVQEKIMARDSYRCIYCGSTENLGLDHVIAYSKGGSSEAFNLVVCCWPCNTKKGDKNPAMFIAEILGAKELILKLAREAVIG